VSLNILSAPLPMITTLVQNNELLILILAIAVVIFWHMNKSNLTDLPQCRTLYTGFCFLLASWVFTIVESYVLEELFNMLEHIFLMLASAFLMVWVFMVFGTYSPPEPFHGIPGMKIQSSRDFDKSGGDRGE